MVHVNLNCKGATVSIQSKQIEIDVPKRSANFIQQLREEVEALPKQERRKVRKELKLMSATFLSTLSLATPAMANSNNQIVSPDLTEFLTQLIFGAVLIGVFLVILAKVAAGIVQLFPRTEDFVAEWSQNITKGFGRILSAVPIVVMMVLLYHLLFGGNSHFIDIWPYLPTFRK